MFMFALLCGACVLPANWRATALCHSVVVPQQLGSFVSPVDPEKDCSKVLSLNFAFVLCL